MHAGEAPMLTQSWMWQAIEHKGPGEYDEEYIEYVYEVLKVAEKYGLHIYVDPHQVWREGCWGCVGRVVEGGPPRCE